MKFCVITKVPDPNKGESGNLAFNGGAWLDPQAKGLPYDAPPVKLDPMLLLWLRTEVFVPGEILFTNDDTRELCGKGRKPSKWDVEYEMFDSPNEALARAQQITEEEVCV